MHFMAAQGRPRTFDFHFATMRANAKTWHACDASSEIVSQ